MNKKTKIKLIIATVFTILIISSIFTVDQRQKALVLQFGEPIRIMEKPGMKFKIPFMQDVIFFDNRIIDLSIADQEVISSDQKRLIINAFAKYKIIDPLKFYSTAHNYLGLQNKLAAILDSSMRQVIGSINLSELLTSNRSLIMSGIKDLVSRESEIFGIKIIDVRITRADLPKENSDAIFARMQSEREKEAREIRARGAEEAFKIKAEAEKERVIILSEAKKKSDLTKGKGEAQAGEIYASSYQNDPEFADFYRSMNAYKESFAPEKTKMIISPNGEFFRYFNSIEGVKTKPQQSQQ